MDKWSAYDLYTKLGHLYAQKISLFKDAFTTYAQGYSGSKALYAELTAHSRQFRLFLAEVESAHSLTLSAFLDRPLVHIQRTLELLKQIRHNNNNNMSSSSNNEASQIDSVLIELRKILANLSTGDHIALKQDSGSLSMTTNNSTTDVSSLLGDTTLFMNDHGSVISTIHEEEDDEEEEKTVCVAAPVKIEYDQTSCCSSSSSSSNNNSSSSLDECSGNFSSAFFNTNLNDDADTFYSSIMSSSEHQSKAN